MRSEKAFELLNNGILKSGTKVKMSGLKGFDKFTEIENAYKKRARPGELEDDWVVVVIDGKIYDATWIDEIEGYKIP